MRQKRIKLLSFLIVGMLLFSAAGMPDGFSIMPIAHADTTSSMFLVADIDAPIDGSIPISNKNDLQAIRNNLSGNYHLTNDIDLSGVDWIPIGSYDTAPFAGIFDGQGHVVRNMNVTSGVAYTSGGLSCSGLFGFIQGATIKNVGLEDAMQFLRTYSAGGFCGYAYGGTFYNCYNASDVISSDIVGGICGQIGASSTFTYCYNIGNVHSTASSASSGTNASQTSRYTAHGILGRQAIGFSGANIFIHCHNVGEVSAPYAAGGITNYLGVGSRIEYCSNWGGIQSSNTAGGIVSDGIAGEGLALCFNTGNVSGRYNSGAISASASGSMQNCFNSGTVSSTSAGASGIANGGEITYCYNSGQIIANSTSSTVAGGISSGTRNITSGTYTSLGTIDSCVVVSDSILGYALGSTQRDAYLIGGLVITNTLAREDVQSQGNFINDATQMLPLSEFYKQSTYKSLGWDFDTVWAMPVNGGFPILQWAEGFALPSLGKRDYGTRNIAGSQAYNLRKDFPGAAALVSA